MVATVNISHTTILVVTITTFTSTILATIGCYHCHAILHKL